MNKRKNERMKEKNGGTFISSLFKTSRIWFIPYLPGETLPPLKNPKSLPDILYSFHVVNYVGVNLTLNASLSLLHLLISVCMCVLAVCRKKFATFSYRGFHFFFFSVFLILIFELILFQSRRFRLIRNQQQQQTDVKSSIFIIIIIFF